MRNCDYCGGKRWIALIDPKTGIQKQTPDGRPLYKCFRNSKHIQAEEHAYPPLQERGKQSILYFDLEISKSIYMNYGRRVRSGYLNGKDVIQEYFVISWAASYMNSGKVFSACVTQEQALRGDDSDILPYLNDLLQSADIIAGHNSDAFDLKKINARFLINGLRPVQGHDGKRPKTVDSLKIARSVFDFEDNSLDALCKKFGLNGKDKITDDDWRDIVQTGNPKTLAKVNKYCRGDVKNGKELMSILLPYSNKNYDFAALKTVRNDRW